MPLIVKTETQVSSALHYIVGVMNISAGVPKITETNYPTFVRRIRLLEELWGYSVNENGEGRFLHDEELRLFMGATFNISPYTDTAFHLAVNKAWKEIQANKGKSSADWRKWLKAQNEAFWQRYPEWAGRL
jgi:hypothetical protein